MKQFDILRHKDSDSIVAIEKENAFYVQNYKHLIECGYICIGKDIEAIDEKKAIVTLSDNEWLNNLLSYTSAVYIVLVVLILIGITKGIEYLL